MLSSFARRRPEGTAARCATEAAGRLAEQSLDGGRLFSGSRRINSDVGPRRGAALDERTQRLYQLAPTNSGRRWQCDNPRAKLAALALVLVICSWSAGRATAQADPSKYPPPNNNCRNTGSFERWLADFRKEAAAKGISRATISAALDGMTLDPGIIARDRRQSFFAQSFTCVLRPS